MGLEHVVVYAECTAASQLSGQAGGRGSESPTAVVAACGGSRVSAAGVPGRPAWLEVGDEA
jgi:hypothetical protein